MYSFALFLNLYDQVIPRSVKPNKHLYMHKISDYQKGMQINLQKENLNRKKILILLFYTSRGLRAVCI